jgi:hypothetical protein
VEEVFELFPELPFVVTGPARGGEDEGLDSAEGKTVIVGGEVDDGLLYSSFHVFGPPIPFTRFMKLADVVSFITRPGPTSMEF